jgi:hypothetical protein
VATGGQAGSWRKGVRRGHTEPPCPFVATSAPVAVVITSYPSQGKTRGACARTPGSLRWSSSSCVRPPRSTWRANPRVWCTFPKGICSPCSHRTPMGPVSSCDQSPMAAPSAVSTTLAPVPAAPTRSTEQRARAKTSVYIRARFALPRRGTFECSVRSTRGPLGSRAFVTAIVSSKCTPNQSRAGTNVNVCVCAWESLVYRRPSSSASCESRQPYSPRMRLTPLM